MEAQPQLLLLQKTMLVAEGVGRRLFPGVNMWELARPLIEGWMRENMGAEARMRDAIDDLLDGLERLPRLIGDMGESLDSLSRNGLRIDPASLESFAAAQRAGRSRWPVWTLGAAAVAILAALLA